MLRIVDGIQWSFDLMFQSPLLRSQWRPLGHCLCPGLYQPLMITRLSTLVYLMWSVGSTDPSCSWNWAVLLWNAFLGCSPHYSELPLNTEPLSIVLLGRLCTVLTMPVCCWVFITGSWFLSLLCGPTAFCVRPLCSWVRDLWVLLCSGDGKEGFILCCFK